MNLQITFFLKTQKQSSASLYLYGNLPEFGGGDPSKGIPLDRNPENNAYSWKKELKITNPIPNGQIPWYSYYYKTKFGAIVREVCPKRFLNLTFACDCTFYDTFDIPTSIGDLIVRFRVHYKTVYGQELYVCGDPKEMGSWNPRRAVQLSYTGNDYWEGTIRLPLNDKPQTLFYKYIVYTSPRNFFWEGEENHRFEIGAAPSPTIFEINDVFHWNDPLMDAYSTSPFVDVINRRISSASPLSFIPNSMSDTVKINFVVKCPYVKPNQDLYIVGSANEIGNWIPEKGYRMTDYYFPSWKATIVFQNGSVPFEYKYCILDKMSSTVKWESRPNRVCPLDAKNYTNHKCCDESFPRSIIINDWFTNPNTDKFKGFGIKVPLSSLRSARSCGIGQYTDLRSLVDLCGDFGSSLIHLLPINDTTTDGGWADSNPYRQISCFALHPIYIDLLAIKNIPKYIVDEVAAVKSELDSFSGVDYPRVFAFKQQKLHQIYEQIKDSLDDNEEFDNFISHNTQWLQPYALYSVFRDRYDNDDFRSWPSNQTVTDRELQSLIQSNFSDIQFYYWVQFICDEQLKDARQYSAARGVVLKGDLAISVHHSSVDCWMYPKLFDVNYSVGSFPSKSTFLGNGHCHDEDFPPFNWAQHAATDFSWWRLRLRRMETLFHSVCIERVLDFFRAWEIPRGSCCRSLLGHWGPALSFSRAELRDRGIFDLDRFVKPYVRWHLLKEKFALDAEYIAETFFKSAVCAREDQIFVFKPELSSEVQIREFLAHLKIDDSKRRLYEEGLFELIGNVLLVEDKTKPDHFHVRAQMLLESVKEKKNPLSLSVITKSSSSTVERGQWVFTESSSWSELAEPQKSIIKELYYEYTYRRQTNLWLELSYPKFKMIEESTNMLICTNAAIGSSPRDAALSTNLEKRGLLSLRVQRLPKLNNNNNNSSNNYYYRNEFNDDDENDDISFDKIRDMPYFSVAMPSTHQTAALREWWESDREVTARFWRDEIWRNDEAPTQCEAWISELVLKQHLWSNAMWTVFLLQDLAGVDDRFRRQNPAEERICKPEDPQYHWDYRYPYSIEELANARDFTYRIRSLVEASNRI